MTTLYTRIARRRAAAPLLARLARYARIATRRLLRLKFSGAGHSPAAAIAALVAALREAVDAAP